MQSWIFIPVVLTLVGFLSIGAGALVINRAGHRKDGSPRLEAVNTAADTVMYLGMACFFALGFLTDYFTATTIAFATMVSGFVVRVAASGIKLRTTAPLTASIGQPPDDSFVD